jgi:beta-lactamase class A
MNILKNKKFTLRHLMIFSVVIAISTWGITGFCNSEKNSEQISGLSSPTCKVDIKRLSGLKYIRPIMFADEECESDNLAGAKQRVTDIISRYKATDEAACASIYLKDLNSNDWTSINHNEKYEPGSLFKVPILITILKMDERNPGFLNKVITYSKPLVFDKNVAYVSETIKVGQTYSVKELLNYMIKYSDNNATALLETHMDFKIFQKIFEDLGLAVPELGATVYHISANEYSFFMRAIYNAAYLTIDDSEYAAELLTQCRFSDGIIKGLPSGIVVAHKFGESGDQAQKQLHESGIVYIGNNPYLLTVMTRGKENKKLAQLITEISQAVFVEMSNHSASTM